MVSKTTLGTCTCTCFRTWYIRRLDVFLLVNPLMKWLLTPFLYPKGFTLCDAVLLDVRRNAKN